MIATILHSSSNFSAVKYNELKVEHGQAELVAMKNFGAIEKRPDLASIQEPGTPVSRRHSSMLPFPVRVGSIPVKSWRR